jgi:hypothetical protein
MVPYINNTKPIQNDLSNSRALCKLGRTSKKLKEEQFKMKNRRRKKFHEKKKKCLLSLQAGNNNRKCQILFQNSTRTRNKNSSTISQASVGTVGGKAPMVDWQQ